MIDARKALPTVALTLALSGCAVDPRAVDVGCATTLKDYCTSGDRSSPLCVGGFDDARNWCTSDTMATARRQLSLTPSACSGYFQIGARSGDTSYAYYYDAGSGELAAVFAGGADRALACVAGPRRFHPIECPRLDCVGPTDELAAAQSRTEPR